VDTRHCEPHRGEAIQQRNRIEQRSWIASSAFGLLAMTKKCSKRQVSMTFFS